MLGPPGALGVLGAPGTLARQREREHVGPQGSGPRPRSYRKSVI